MADIDEQPMFGPEDVARAVQHLIDNAYIGELDRDDLEEIARIVLTSYRAGQAATPDGPRRWASQVPAEPGPDVLVVQIVETGQRWERRYAKDQPDRWAWGHWLLEWSQLLCAWAVGRTLTDATPAADGQDGDGRG